MNGSNTLNPGICLGAQKRKKQKGSFKRMRQGGRSSRGEEEGKGGMEGRGRGWRCGSEQSQEGKPGGPVRKAPGLLYLHEGSQDFPGFLVELLSIPLRVESL